MGNTILGGIQGLQGLEQLKAMRLANTQAQNQYSSLQDLIGTLGGAPKGDMFKPLQALPATDFNAVVTPGQNAPKAPDMTPLAALPQTPFNNMVGGVETTPNGLRQAQDAFNSLQTNLIARAFPKEIGSSLATAMFAPPTAHEIPAGGSLVFTDRRGTPIGSPISGAPQLTDFARDLIASGVKPGSPEFAKAVADKVAKDTYISQLDPVERAKTEAQTKEAEAQTGLASSRANLMNNTGIDPDTVEFRAQMYAAGDQDGAFKGLPNSIYGSQAKKAIADRGAQIAMQSGVGGAGQAAANAAYAGNKSGIRTAATAGAKMDTLSTEVQKFADLAQQASDKLPRGNFTPITKAEQMIQSGVSDPDLAAFVAANTSLVNAYSAVAGRGTPTVAGQQHAYEMLSTATGPEAYKAVVKQLLRETEAARQSPNVTIEDIRKRITAPAGGGVTMPAVANPSATGGSDIQPAIPKATQEWTRDANGKLVRVK